MSKIGVIIIATNAYFVLGVRFVRKFVHHYKGNENIEFHFFSDQDPKIYLPDNINLVFHQESHNNWVDATNSKFKNIISLQKSDCDYLYYFDADTNITKDFKEDWFIGDLVGGEHYGNRTWLANGAGFDKNPASKAYVNPASRLPKTYYYGAFFGGKKDKVIDFCKTLREWQLEDKKISYEPGVNDESYINAYFHNHPPTIVACEKFAFDISDKGGIQGTRDPKLQISNLKKEILSRKNEVFDIRNNKVVWM